MNEIIEKENIIIENMIYEIRDTQVMLDFEIVVTECYRLFIKKGMINYE